MAWIEAHQSLGEHPKLKKAARLLGVPRVQMVGHLFYLWWWALDYAPDGDVSRYDADELADAAKWDGDPDAFIDALLGCSIGEHAGLLERTPDGRLLVHDWWEYAGKLVQRRQVDAERKRRDRSTGQPQDVHSRPSITSADVQRTSAGHPLDIRAHRPTNQPTETQPTNPTQPTGAPAAADAAPDAPLAITPGSVSVTTAGGAGVGVPQDGEHTALWDAFTAVFGEARGKTERQRRGEACKRARDARATPDEIRTAAAHWPNVMGDATITELGITSNLGKLLHGPQVNGRSNGTTLEHRQRVTQTAVVPADARAVIEAKRAQRAIARGGPGTGEDGR